MKNQTSTQMSTGHVPSIDTDATTMSWYQRYQQFTPGALDTFAALAATRLEQGNYRGATETFAFLLIAQPDHIAYLTGLGYCLQRLDRPADAIVILARVVMLDPQALYAAMMIAECRLALGEIDAAVEMLRLLVQYRNEHPEPSASVNETATRAAAFLTLLSASASEAPLP